MGVRIALPLLLLALLCESTFAGVASANLQEISKKCDRSHGPGLFLKKLPAGLRDTVSTIYAKHGERIESMISQHLNPNTVSALESAITKRLLPPESKDVSSFIQLENDAPDPFTCYLFGVLVTFSIVIAAWSVYKFVEFEVKFKEVPDNQIQVSFEEFCDMSQTVYLKEKTREGKVQTQWALPPPKFTPEEQELYRKFIFDKQPAPPVLKPKFEMRRALEKSKYEVFMKSVLFQKRPISALSMSQLATLVFTVLHVTSIAMALRLHNE